MKRLVLMMSLSVLNASLSLAQTAPEKAENLRVGGSYAVTEINKLSKNKQGFEITFHSEKTTGVFDRITLKTQHLNLTLQEYHLKFLQKSEDRFLRISAEIAQSGTSKTAQAKQILVFIPKPEGHMPVWILSSDHQVARAPVKNLLKLHAPQNDFRVL